MPFPRIDSPPPAWISPVAAPVAFDEYDHLLTSSGSGIAGLPGHWQAGLLLALVAVVVWILSAARRFGPATAASRELAGPTNHCEPVPESCTPTSTPLPRSSRRALRPGSGLVRNR